MSYRKAQSFTIKPDLGTFEVSFKVFKLAVRLVRRHLCLLLFSIKVILRVGIKHQGVNLLKRLSTTAKAKRPFKDELSFLFFDQTVTAIGLETTKHCSDPCIGIIDITKASTGKATYSATTLVKLLRGQKHNNFCRTVAACIDQVDCNFSIPSNVHLDRRPAVNAIIQIVVLVSFWQRIHMVLHLSQIIECTDKRRKSDTLRLRVSRFYMAVVVKRNVNTFPSCARNNFKYCHRSKL